MLGSSIPAAGASTHGCSPLLAIWLSTLYACVCARVNVLEDTTLLYLSRPQPDTELEGMLAAEVERLRRAILDLPEEQRRVLLLAAFQGRTSREISEREGIPLGTAKTRLRAAMLRLRTALGVTNE